MTAYEGSQISLPAALGTDLRELRKELIQLHKAVLAANRCYRPSRNNFRNQGSLTYATHLFATLTLASLLH